MASTLTVTINRDDVHTIAPATATFEATGDFVVELQNEGQATHVHLHLDDELAEIASIDGSNNRFVEAGKSATVPVSVTGGDRPVTGHLKIVTGYGAETAYVDVDIVTPTERRETVSVDENLSVKQPSPDPPKRRISAGTLGIVILAILALILAGGAILFIDEPVVMGAAGLVVVVVLGGLLFSLR